MQDSSRATTIPELLRSRAQQSPDSPAFAFEVGETWALITWCEFWHRVQVLAAALRSRGLHSGDHIGLLAPTSLEWEIMHHAALLAGGVAVGLEPHETAERLQWIADHAELDVLVVGDKGLLAKLSPAQLERYKLVVLVAGVEAPGDDARYTTFAVLESEGRTVSAREMVSVLPSPDMPAALLYTSGTTGLPKGILYRHAQVVLAVRSIVNSYPSLPSGSRFVCWLPLANLFQRIMNLAAMHLGGTTFLVSDPVNIVKALPTAQPDVFIGVPRFFEKLHARIEREIASRPWILQRLIRWAIAAGHRFAQTKLEDKSPPTLLVVEHLFADALVLRRLRRVMGARARFMVTGSAPTPMHLLEFFFAIGLPLYEAYGMSENIVPVALNTIEWCRLGTVGRALPENKLKINDDSELLIRGAGVFSGYYKDERNAELFTNDGYYRTGDYASMDKDGFVRLHGRRSEMIKTSAGRRISPLPVEAALKELAYVDRAVVLGNARKCLTAVLALDSAELERRRSLTDSSARRVSKMSISADAGTGLVEDLLGVLEGLAEHERPAGFLVLNRLLSIERGELTPNLKVKRCAIEQIHASQLNELYAMVEQQAGQIVLVTEVGELAQG